MVVGWFDRDMIHNRRDRQMTRQPESRYPRLLAVAQARPDARRRLAETARARNRIARIRRQPRRHARSHRLPAKGCRSGCATG